MSTGSQDAATEGAEEAKAATRRAAFDARKAAHAEGRAERAAAAAEMLLAALGPPDPGTVVAGYRAIRTEIDPTPAMDALHAAGCRLSVPVIEGAGLPLTFRAWSPGCAEVEGPFGALVPAEGDWLVPRILIVPLVAFDSAGFRLGYGGGFYDRTLERLRASDPATCAVGYAYAAQELPALPLEPTDQRLDLVVTEEGVRAPR
ncbi:MAG: 5-formyltetrahydrofolate cyclo-ligase [Pseudomonadota bacterium]